MSYNANIPQSSDRISDSQQEILDNFTTLKTFLDKNHVDISTPTGGNDEGKHKFVQFPEQSSDPTTGATEGALLTKASGGSTELFWVPVSSGTAVQLTKGSATVAASGSTFLPGGAILKWGTDTWTSSTKAVTFSSAFTTAIYSVVVTPVGQNTTAWIQSLTTSGFTALRNNSSGSVQFRYIAIGS